MAKKKAPTRPYIAQRFGIQNPYGEIWSCNTFETAIEARGYIAAFWHGTRQKADLDKFKVIPVTVTITAHAE